MKFEKNNPKYEKALRTYFDKVLQNVPIQSICAIDDDGKILGGCGFLRITPLSGGGYLTKQFCASNRSLFKEAA